MTPALLIFGTGSLARATAYAYAGLADRGTVIVAGRRADVAAEVTAVATARSAALGTRVAFTAEAFDAADPGGCARLLSQIRPDVVLVCASLQSPWERTQQPSAWTDLIAAVGFGLTLPLHARITRTVGAAAADIGALLVNACFPDAVNPLLCRLGVPVLCGVGNVSTLAATIQGALKVEEHQIALLAHHVHLHPPADPADEARLWVAGKRYDEVTRLLNVQRRTSRRELNHVTGATAARLLHTLLTGASAATHVPGPNGLPGGYPVNVAGGAVSLRLPAGITQASAVAWNTKAAEEDGVRVDDGRVIFSQPAQQALHGVAPQLAVGFRPSELDAATKELLAVRERLRCAPSRNSV